MASGVMTSADIAAAGGDPISQAAIALLVSGLTGNPVASSASNRSITTVVGSQLLIGPNPERTGLTVTNNGATTIALSVPTPSVPAPLTSVSDAGAIPVAAGATYSFPTAPAGDVYCYATATGAVTVTDSSAPLPDGRSSRRTIGASSRMGQPTTSSTGNLSTTARTSWYARADSDITDHSLVIPGWYYIVSGTSPVVNPSTQTITASIEYPAGVLTQVTFGGNVSATLTPGALLISDAARVRIPAGARFFIRLCVTVAANTNPIVYQQIQNAGSAIQSQFDNALGSTSALSDFTMTYSSSLPPDGSQAGGNSFVAPTAIISTAVTNPNPKAVLIWGDSITYGQGENSQSAFGAQGWPARLLDAIGIPYIKIGRPGIGVASLLQANTALPRALSNLLSVLPVSHTLTQIGTNDIAGGTTAFNEAIDYGKLWALSPGKKPIVATILPRTSSTDNWATPGSQTVITNMGTAITLNNLERTWNGVKYLDVATAASPSLNANVWTGATPPLTPDGVHPSTTGATVISSDANVVAQIKAVFGLS